MPVKRYVAELAHIMRVGAGDGWSDLAEIAALALGELALNQVRASRRDALESL